MSPSLGFLLFLSAILAAEVKGECLNHKCSVINLFYQELKCTPEGPGCCPKRFDCSHLELRLPQYCYVGTNHYKEEEKLPNNITTSACLVECYCTYGNFECAHIDCPEDFVDPPQENCVSQYMHGECCIDSYVCGEDEIANLATCTLDGEDYKEGELMPTESLPCSKCICSKEFNGNLEPPFCSRKYCGYDIQHNHEIRNFCAPIYYRQIFCCAVDWMCDEIDKENISELQSETDDPEMVCKYRGIKLNLGASFMVGHNKRTRCSCEVPPFVHCIIEE